jgi:hypothetical protein
MGTAFATITTHAQAFEQIAARVHTLVNSAFNLGIRYRLANAHVHLAFPKKLKVMLMITILIKIARWFVKYFCQLRHKTLKC